MFAWPPLNFLSSSATAYERVKGTYLALYSLGGRVTSRFRERVLVVYV
jgi:hypothetical protein